jgi:tetratricopeptide (TPR) repeat protein
MKCLEKDPGRRYPTALALAEDLDRYLEGEPLEARPAGVFYRLRKRVARNPAVAAAVLAAAGGAVVASERAETSARVRREQAARKAALEASELCRRSLEALKESKALWRTRRARREEWEALFEEALTLVRRALDRYPELAAGHYTLGEILQAQGRWRGAIGAFDEALRRDPALAKAWYRRGLCHLELYGEAMGGPSGLGAQDGFASKPGVREAQAAPFKARAMEDLRTFARWRGVNEEASGELRFAQAAVALAEGRLDQAESACDELVARSPSDEQVWLLKAKVRFARQAYAAARETLDELVTSVMPQCAGAYYLRALSRQKLGDVSGTLQDAARALELDPRLAAAYVARAWARADEEDNGGAVEEATRAIGVDPEHGPAYYARGWAYERLDRLPEAARDYGRLVELHPTIPVLYTIRGWGWERLDRWEAARQDYAKAVELGHVEADDWANLARAEEHAGRAEAALQAYAQAIGKSPRAAPLYAARARVRAGLKNYAGAVEDARTALALDPRLKPELEPRAARWEAALQEK